MRRLSLAALMIAACGGEPGDAAETEALTGSTTDPSATTGSGSAESEDTASNGEDSSSGAETGVGECGAGSRCMPAPAEGWLGPIARFSATPGETPPPCGEGYPDEALALYEGFATPGPAQCECSCAVHLASVCQVTMYPDTTSPSCLDFSNFIMNGAECTEYQIDNGSLYASIYQNGTPTCLPSQPAVLPEAEWEADVFSCGGAELGDVCDAGVCTPRAPDGFAQQLCIYTQGDNTCPDGPYSERAVLFSTVQDDRGCTACECGDPPAISCAGVFDLYDGNDCTGNVVATGPSNGCTAAVGAGSIHVNLDADTTCPVTTPSEPEGSAEPSGLFTFCCEP